MPFPSHTPRRDAPRFAARLTLAAPLAMSLAATLAMGAPAAAQWAAVVADSARCDTTWVPADLGAISGRRIDTLRIVTLGPLVAVGDRVLDGFHATTRASIVRRQLLFAAGDSVDTLAVAESLRRLRRTRYLVSATLEARACAPSDRLVLAVVTRDAWSTRPVLRMRSPGTNSIGIEERNLAGTGRIASVATELVDGRRANVVAFTDPWLFGTPLSFSARAAELRDGYGWGSALRTRERSVYDPYRLEMSYGRSSRASTDDPPYDYARSSSSLLAGARVSSSIAIATQLLAGVERDRASLRSPVLAVIGPRTVERDFIGGDLGISRRSGRYDTLTWLVPRHGIVDVPAGLETELLVGVGRDFAREAPAAHLDGWVGRMMRLPGTLVVADVWGSAFVGRDWTEDGVLRAALTVYRDARRGQWVARAFDERLTFPSPDLRSTIANDRTAAAIDRRARFAGRTTTLSLERTLRLREVTRSLTLDGALWIAGSARRDLPPRPPDEFDVHAIDVAVAGLGLRLVPASATLGTTRLDVGVPLTRRPGTHQQLVVQLTAAPWVELNRGRGMGGS